jgi:hypothetical protein
MSVTLSEKRKLCFSCSSSAWPPYLDGQSQVAHGYVGDCVLPTAHYVSTKQHDLLPQALLLIRSEGRSCSNQRDVFQPTQTISKPSCSYKGWYQSTASYCLLMKHSIIRTTQNMQNTSWTHTTNTQKQTFWTYTLFKWLWIFTGLTAAVVNCITVLYFV